MVMELVKGEEEVDRRSRKSTNEQEDEDREKIHLERTCRIRITFYRDTTASALVTKRIE